MNTQALMQTVKSIQAFSVKAYLNDKALRLTVKFFDWAFSQRPIQRAVVAHIHCGTPIGKALSERIEEALDSVEVDADNVNGLDRYFENIELDVDSIRGLDRAIDEAVEEAVERTVTEALDDDTVEEHVVKALQNESVQKEITSGVIDAIISRLSN